ncbi:MAG TPA: hypothetical protein VLJ41_06685 [Segetibacter sp.]|nr:hypothetical protein [Segetibacter sp.]
MIQISFWAKQHQLFARTILAVSHLILFVMAVSVAMLLDQVHIHLSFSLALVSLVAMVVSWFLYSNKKPSKEHFKVSYYKRKGCELVFLWASLVLICFMFNKNERVSYFSTYQVLNGSFVSGKTAKGEVSSNIVSPKKELRKQFKELMKELKKSRRAGGKAWLTVLVLLGGIALSFLVLGLSCNISCSGNETLGTVVLIGGLAVVILLMVLLIRSINQSKGAKDKEPNPLSPNVAIPF